MGSDRSTGIQSPSRSLLGLFSASQLVSWGSLYYCSPIHDMRLAYRAHSLPDAQLIADLLRTVGIQARIFNQNAQSIAGEIPPAVACPQVWVMEDEDFAAARALIADHRSRPPVGARYCGRCGEENPGNFLSCWACGEEM